MGVLLNFESVDVGSTVIKTRRFFQNDVPQLEQLAGLAVSEALSSPRMDNDVKTTATSNQAEITIIKSVDAKREIRLIAKAIHRCSPRSQKLLIGQYFKKLTGWQLSQQLAVGHTALDKYKREALIEFANCYASTGRDIRVKTTNQEKGR